jgi:hypothetical protein
MSAVMGVNYTKSLTPSVDNIVAPGVLRGNVKVYQDIYEAAALANPSTIQVGKQLIVGIKVLFIVLTFDALGAATTLSVGDAASATRYINAVATNVAGSKRSDLTDGMNYSVTGTNDDIIVITLGGGAATGTIAINIFTAEE